MYIELSQCYLIKGPGTLNGRLALAIPEAGYRPAPPGVNGQGLGILLEERAVSRQLPVRCFL
jgi:hypothetical protein